MDEGNKFETINSPYTIKFFNINIRNKDKIITYLDRIKKRSHVFEEDRTIYFDLEDDGFVMTKLFNEKVGTLCCCKSEIINELEKLAKGEELNVIGIGESIPMERFKE